MNERSSPDSVQYWKDKLFACELELKQARDAPAQGAQMTGVDRAAVAEAHEHIKSAIARLKADGICVAPPIELHKASHALHHALNDSKTDR